MSTPAPYAALAGRDYSHGELIADAAVHAAAIVAGVIGFSVLFQTIAAHGAVGDGVAMAIYAAGFFLLFGFSCAYNLAPPSPAKWLLRRFDHASIYHDRGRLYRVAFADAGFALGRCIGERRLDRGADGRGSRVVSTGKVRSSRIVRLSRARWAAIISLEPLLAALPAATLALVAIGGALYSIGVAFHLWQSLKFQNAIWRACVTVAAACHFAGVLQAVGR